MTIRTRKRKTTGKVWVGIDLSLTGTGLVFLDESGEIVKKKLIKTGPKDIIEVRILYILKEISMELKDLDIFQINIEGLSFGSRGQSMLELGGLHYYVKINLFRRGYNYKTTPPTTLKKHITGKGTAKKELMLLKIYKKYGIEFTDNNIADAYALARYGMEN